MERRYRASCSSPRSRSAPKCGSSPRTPSAFYAFPSTLHDILYGPRQRLTKYADGMQALPLEAPSSPLPINKEKEETESGVATPAAAATGAVVAEVVAAPDVVLQADGVDAAAAAAPVVEVERTEEEMILPGEEAKAGENATVTTPPGTDAAAAKQEVTESEQKSDESIKEKEEKAAEEGEEPAVEEAPPAKKAAEAAAPESRQEEEPAGDQQVAGEDAAQPTGDAAEGPTEQEEEESRAIEETAAAADTPAADAAPDGSEHEEGEGSTASTSPLPQLRATAECIAFDPAQAETWMADFRDDRSHVPAGVSAFIRNFDRIAAGLHLKLPSIGAAGSPLAPTAGAKKGKKGSTSGFAGSAGGSLKGSLSGSPMELGSRDFAFGGVVVPHPNTNSSGGGGVPARKANALESLGDIWEGRQETPIAVAPSTLRRRGLFGEVEKKQIHHMVVAVLNKVTTNPEKFREVRNELMRLPIPEASAEQLTKIVDAFFMKAVREQHFSHSYADLIVALCKVPEGQHIVGDKTQSLEYRLRVALLKRCQSEFVNSVRAEKNSNTGSGGGNSSSSAGGATQQQKAGESGASTTSTGAAGESRTEENAGETEKERRDRMCGNVRFVCELFLRDVVTGAVISFILRVCLLGSEFGEFVLPPVYTPTESQVDEVITAVKTVKERYFTDNSEGRRILPFVVGQLDYWVQHYPVSRCRFVLMSIVEELRSFLVSLAAPAPAPVPAPAPPAPAAAPVPANNALVLVSAANSEGTAPTSPPHSFETALVPMHAGAVVSVVDGTQSPLTSTLVGGQPLPAPRSRQAGNASVSESAGSFAAAATHAESAVGSPLLAIAVTLSSRPLLQGVRAEAIAKFMTALSTKQCTVEELAAQLCDQYGNVLPVLSAWLDRCLSVAKEENCRKQTGALFIACVEQLAGHLNPKSPEWASTTVACREQLHELAMECIQRALEGKLYEDLRIFHFWAQVVLSDHDRLIYDEELLNEGLELVAYTAPLALRNYLVEVTKYVNQVLLKPESLPWHPATEESNFVRFRPLLVLHSLVLSGGPQEAQKMLDNVLTLADVRQQSLELRLYHAFRTGTPTHEVVFEQLRSGPRLTSRDPTLAAEVVSAILIAELCSDGVALVENTMDLVQITVDGVNRAAREMALVAEVYEVLRYAPKALPRTAAARVVRKYVYMHILSDETMERADRFFAEEHEGVMDKPEGESQVLEPLPPPATADFPRIADRHHADDVLSASTSLRSVNGNVNDNNSHSGHVLGSSANHGGADGGTVTDFRSSGAGNASGSHVMERIPSSNASSLADYRPRHADRQSRGPHNSNSQNQHNTNGDSTNSRRQRGSSEVSSRHSQRPTSPTRSHDDASKRLYRNSYRNRRRSHEGGSEMVSSAGGSTEATPHQRPVAHTPSSTYESSLENSRLESSSNSRYSRGGHGSGGGGGGRGGPRGNGRGGSGMDRGAGGGRGGRGGRGGPHSSGGGGGGRGGSRGGGGGGPDEMRRGNSRYNTRGGGSHRE